MNASARHCWQFILGFNFLNCSHRLHFVLDLYTLIQRSIRKLESLFIGAAGFLPGGEAKTQRGPSVLGKWFRERGLPNSPYQGKEKFEF